MLRFQQSHTAPEPEGSLCHKARTTRLVGPIPLYWRCTCPRTLTDPYYNLLALAFPSAAKPVPPVSTCATHISSGHRFSMYGNNAHATSCMIICTSQISKMAHTTFLRNSLPNLHSRHRISREPSAVVRSACNLDPHRRVAMGQHRALGE